MMFKTFFILLMLIAFNTHLKATELSLSINLAKQTGEYHNPYVAAWIEDETGQSVRTLLLWREGAKWLKDLRTWWRKVGRKNPSLVDGITSATRPAGNYKLNFSTLDDQDSPLKKGTYILKVEVVRENGGRAIIKQNFTLNGQAQSFTLPSTQETEQALFIIKE